MCVLVQIMVLGSDVLRYAAAGLQMLMLVELELLRCTIGCSMSTWSFAMFVLLGRHNV